MDIHKATASYEAWLASHTPLVEEDIASKHAQMNASSFAFFRGTFYRWIQLWPDLCAEEAEGPAVLAVGDLHVENFGTWRDQEGRLIWGCNDFDEACQLSYSADLVRLAASVLLARRSESLSIDPDAACAAILGGYSDAIKAGGRPFVLGERHGWLAAIAQGELRNPVAYWQKFKEQSAVKEAPPPQAMSLLEELLPETGLKTKIIHQVKGMGSMGRQRFAALADWRGGWVAREAKALAPSAAAWAGEKHAPLSIEYPAIVSSAVRCPDPFLKVSDNWLGRRLAPDCSRIELASLMRTSDEARLLRAMGWEAANIHLGTADAAKPIRRDLRQRSGGWLKSAAKRMLKKVLKDWEEWKEPMESAPDK